MCVVFLIGFLFLVLVYFVMFVLILVLYRFLKLIHCCFDLFHYYCIETNLFSSRIFVLFSCGGNDPALFINGLRVGLLALKRGPGD